MALYKTYGCSFTEYQWPTWTFFLGKVATVKRHGVPGWGNEDIARSILHNADDQSIQVVMWSGFDRVSRDNNKKFKPIGEGKYTGNDYNLERLLSRTYEQIYFTNRYCLDKNIEIYNFLAFPLELGEGNMLQKIKHPLHKFLPDTPISFSEWCLDNKAMIINKNDGHPSVSQHLYYYNTVISPILRTKKIDENIEHLRNQELAFSRIKTKSNWKNYTGPIDY